MGKRIILLLGGARSGKSRYAEEWAKQRGDQILFVATAEALDEEMRVRIAKHRESRPPNWLTLGAQHDVGAAISATGYEADTVIVDCLTVLCANVLLRQPDNCSQDQIDGSIRRELDSMLDAYAASNATWLIISNEVGMGIVPPSRLGRYYRDALGRANQYVAKQADDVVLLVAGIPMQLKPTRLDTPGP